METKNRKIIYRFSGLVSSLFFFWLSNTRHHPHRISNAKSRLPFNRSKYTRQKSSLSFVLFDHISYLHSRWMFLCVLLIMNQLLRSLLRLAPYFPLFFFARNMKSQQLLPLILDKCEFEYVIPWSEWSNFFLSQWEARRLAFIPLSTVLYDLLVLDELKNCVVGFGVR